MTEMAKSWTLGLGWSRRFWSDLRACGAGTAEDLMRSDRLREWVIGGGVEEGKLEDVHVSRKKKEETADGEWLDWCQERERELFTQETIEFRGGPRRG